MRPFDVSPVLEPLREMYLSANSILDAAKQGDKDARYAIARLWLSEGIPYSFRTRPGLYESLRRWLALRLNVQAKEVTLVGSGRQGFCLNPGPNLRQPFGKHSDLDLSVVSNYLFQQLETAYMRWEADYASGIVAPRHKREYTFWEANKKCVRPGLSRGFIDPHKIPTWKRYHEAQVVAQAMYEAHEKLKLSKYAPTVRKLSVRVYRDWDSFVRQIAINLEYAACKVA